MNQTDNHGFDPTAGSQTQTQIQTQTQNMQYQHQPPQAREYLGLSTAEAKKRAAEGKSNESVKAASKTVGQIILSNTVTYFNVFFTVLAVLIATAGQWKELTFMVVVVVNSVIGIVQELKSKRTLDKLTILTAPKGTVLRDGTETQMDVHELVLDDVVIFRAGEQIYADAVVIDGNCKVNESLVTGEADEIDKAAGSQLLSGSFIVSGVCRARLTAVGKNSFVSKLTVEAKRTKRVQKSDMMRSLSRLVAVVGVIAIPLGAAMLQKEMNVLDRDYPVAVTSTVAALVGMIPEGLYLLTSLALAAGVLRLSEKRTLVHEMSCIETLAHVDVLCVDKTGTITEPTMSVGGIIPLCRDRFDDRDINTALTDYCAAIKSAVGGENDTMRALCERFSGAPTSAAASVMPFTSSKKYGLVELQSGVCYLLGAPDVMLGEHYGKYAELTEAHAARGERVLLLAFYGGRRTEKESIPPSQLLPMALITLKNKVRDNAKRTFSYFAEQGVDIKVISGDNHTTVSAVASEAGIEGAERAVDARTLTTDDDIIEAAGKYTVFGRVTPEQKKKLVLAIKAAGHTVAMTGDGINDVLALKEADCSVAMASGSSVAGQVANIVLLDSDFSAMPHVVAEGRRVINNIERSASLYLVKNIFSLVLAVVTLIFTLPYPLSPSQLTLVNMCTIGIPSFILAMEPNGERVSGRFMRHVLGRALPAALADLSIVIGLILFQLEYDMDEMIMGVICTMIMGVVGLHMVDRVCRPYRGKPVRVILIVSMTLMFFIGFMLMNAYLNETPLEWRDTLILILYALLGGPALNFFIKWQDRITGGVCFLRERFRKAAKKTHGAKS